MKYWPLYFFLLYSGITFSNLLEITGSYNQFHDISESNFDPEQRILDVYTESRIDFEQAMISANKRVLSACSKEVDFNEIQCELAKSNFSRKLKGLEMIYDPSKMYRSIQRNIWLEIGHRRSTSSLVLWFAIQTIFGIFICVILPSRT